jgi:hypothetical protein
VIEVRNRRLDCIQSSVTSHGSLDNGGIVRFVEVMLRSIHCMWRHAFIEEGRRRHSEMRCLHGQLSIMIVKAFAVLGWTKKQTAKAIDLEAETGTNVDDIGGIRDGW